MSRSEKPFESTGQGLNLRKGEVGNLRLTKLS